MTVTQPHPVTFIVPHGPPVAAPQIGLQASQMYTVECNSDFQHIFNPVKDFKSKEKKIKEIEFLIDDIFLILWGLLNQS